ncbi:MAG: kinase [Patescibacteria group bacterium]
MVITRTPFRISFFGGGTDYPVWFERYGGAVLNTAINKYCYITTRYLPPFWECKYRLRYTTPEETKEIQQIKHPSIRECLLHLNFNKGIEMQHNTDIPGMSGLGSSSAFTVGFLNSLHSLLGEKISKEKLAQEAIHVEQRRIGENVGSQDQTIAAFGGFRKIDFLNSGKIKVEQVAVNESRKKELEKNLLLFFIGLTRNASLIAGEQIKNIPQKTVELRAMRKIVDDAHTILIDEKHSLDSFGELLHESWKIKKTLSSKISNPIIDDIYEAALSAGALGGKVLGAGGGGFMLFYVPREYQAKVRSKLSGLLEVPFEFEELGSKVIYQLPESKWGYSPSKNF